MKKILCIILALSMIVATAMVISGCGDDKSKSSSKTDATKAPTSAATVATSSATQGSAVPVPQATQDDQQNETTDEQIPTDPVDATDAEYYNNYGGLTGQQAILKALGFAGEGYQCVSYDKQYLQNQEAWYVGVQATDGSDNTVYYIYVNADQCVAETEIPSIGGGSDTDPAAHGGVTEAQAINIAIQNQEGEYSCVSADAIEIDGSEYWRIGLQASDSTDTTVRYYLVNRYSCFEE